MKFAGVWKFNAQTNWEAAGGQPLPPKCQVSLEKSIAPLFHRGRRSLMTLWTLLWEQLSPTIQKSLGHVQKSWAPLPVLEVSFERKWSSPKQRAVKPRDAAISVAVSYCIPIGLFKILTTKMMSTLWVSFLFWEPFPVGVLPGGSPGNLLLKTQNRGN